MQLRQTHHSMFYGWWVVGACFLINLFVAGVVHYGFTAFFEPIVLEFGWSYAQVSLAASLRGLEMGLLSPVLGLIVDRFGPRRLVFGGAVIMGFGLTLLSHVNTLAMFYVAFILITMGMSACIGVVPMTAVAYWFRKKVAIASGIAISGVALGGLIVPLATALIDMWGWRMAILSLGLGMCVIIMPLSLLLRHKPEQYGYLPDGEVMSAEVAGQPITTAKAQITEPKIGSRQVLASRTFWHISLAFMGSLLVITAVITHIMPYFSSIGITRSTSSLIASAVPIVTIFGRLGFGWLGDRFEKRRLTAVALFMVSLGMLSFAYIATGGIWLVLPFIIVFGVGYGGCTTMTPVLVREYFGMSNFGTILGFIMGVITAGQIVGPPLAGWVFDTWGSYQGIWFGFAGLTVVATVVMLTVPQFSLKDSKVVSGVV